MMNNIPQWNTEDIFQRNVPGVRETLAQHTVAIAGCGGAGSNAAVALARAGIGKLIIADCDTVEPSNLNRQYFFIGDIGKPKTDALKLHLLHINPSLSVEDHFTTLTPDNIFPLLAHADLLIEAFDRAESKVWLIESWCARFPHKPIVCVSGIGGYGETGGMKVINAGNVWMCGDFTSDMNIGLTSARVAIAANMQANLAIQILMENTKK